MSIWKMYKYSSNCQLNAIGATQDDCQSFAIRNKAKTGAASWHAGSCFDGSSSYGISLPVLTDNGERFLSPNDIGKILNVTGEAVKQWIYRRKLPAVKLANGYWKVKVADFEGFLKARTEVGRRQILITDGGDAGTEEIVKAIEELGHQPVWRTIIPTHC